MSGTCRAATAASSRTTFSNLGPSPWVKRKPSPIASGTVKMSLNKMAASKGYLSKGCKVTSVANSVLVAKPMKLPALARVAQYSGR